MSKLHIEEVVEKGSLYPMIINFQNGYITEDFQTVTCTLLDNEQNGKRSVVTELDSIVYAGEEENEELGNTFVLARNRETGKVRLIEVGCAELKPFFPKESHAPTQLETSTLELSRKFGSKRSKKAMEQNEKLKVNVETVTEQMKNATKNVTEEKIDLTPYMVQESEDFYVPPINRAATDKRDVYKLDNILSKEQFDKVYAEVHEKDYASEFHPLIQSIVKDSQLDLHKMVLAMYASMLFKIYNALVKDIYRKNYSVCDISPTLNEIVLNNFTVTTVKNRTRPTMYKDKALCHAIVFCLLLNDFQLDLELLCKNLNLSTKLGTLKAKATGASIVTSGKKKILQLKVPLPSAKPFRRKSAKF